MAEVSEAHAISLSQHVTALRQAFGSSRWAGEIGVTLTEAFYRWKYDTPAGQAIIAYVRNGARPVSGVSAFPLIFNLPGRGPIKGWQIGDIMTAPEMRGRGLYRECLSDIVQRLDDQLLICFPNGQSQRAIEQAGFRAVAEVQTFVRPILPVIGGRLSEDQNEINFLDLSAVVSKNPPYSSVHRDAKYLAWRYEQHPAFSYQVIGGGAEGFAIVRSFRLFGMNVAIVMEFHSTEGLAARLLHKVQRWTGKNGMVAVFLMANWFPFKPLRSGYFFVPPSLMPKQQVLFVRYPRAQTVDLRWRTQIGDWDGL
ncbi:hypothetical protein A5906_15065 [Bradyrhizobium sacchari]|uniref:Acetyltransferase (GNAT) family protein n=1 Tax=Bradyrhizobium sacchari TaxID=1399419 RepID=A0A560JNA0_9BRAD|nr:GNAT family N-acetyltransferase [Bradyrhizobium sacchari]OPY94262.1 hypothetical protein A5906_15065 [Bradyrhizobium sacchari]TWB59203.1 acetyltransferase (GNAT) family protein [Bradyrhizobium sacchari]TWB72437.1 acetyltransferase (GNAT) family protein [Bradyrhizobium sacchari]